MTTTPFNGLRQNQRLKSAGTAFFWLAAFFIIYCARPEDWIPAIGIVPLAKITGIGAFLAFLFGTGVGKRKFRELPSEAHFLLGMIVVLMISALLSPVWKGGALTRTMDFAKVFVAWALVFFLITDIKKLRSIIFIQAAAVPLICIVSIAKGRASHPRLDGVLGGIYSNPNDLAFAIVLSLPFCFMFMLTARGIRKLPWIVGMLAMGAALVLTESRGGFITLIVAGAVALWHFGVKGKRLHLIAATGLVGIILLGVAGGPLKERFATIWSDDADPQQSAALGSYEQRKYLMRRALEGIEHYPIFGIGARNFEVYSLQWREVHMTYLQIAVEGGLLSLILYLMFFARGFRNLRVLLKRKDLDKETVLIVGALHSSLIGFVVGAVFSPEAYVYFPYFSVAYTSALWAIVKRNDALKAASGSPPPTPSRPAWQLPGRQANPDRVPVGQ